MILRRGTLWHFAICIGLFFPRVGSADILKDELRSRSLTDGLGIAHFSDDGELEVMYFDKASSVVTVRIEGMHGLYDIEPRHQALLISLGTLMNALGNRMRDRGHPLFAIDDLNGKTISTVGLTRWPRQAVLSPELDLVAVLSLDTEGHRVSLSYGTTDWTKTREIYAADLDFDPEDPHFQSYKEENFSWSQEEKFLAYSRGGAVYIFDTSSGRSRKIAEGSDPCWSPDGRSIAFRSLSRALMIYTVSTGQTEKLTNGIEVIGFPRWSPDSRYLLFTKYSPFLALRNLSTLPATDFEVMRIQDKAMTTVYTPAMGMDNRRFYWIDWITGK